MHLSANIYEVNDIGEPLVGIDSKNTIKDVKVIVESVTDDISLNFNNTINTNDVISDSTDANPTDDTYTITTNLSEGGNIIDLKSILTATSGTQNDATPDLDGSEQRSYTVSGIPEGTVITLGGVSATAGANGIATVNFNNASEKIADPDFTMTLAEHYSGEVDATITLKVRDVDDHYASGEEPETLTEAVYLKVHVDPVADQVTLNVSQARGLEDAGRDDGNTTNDSNAGDINAKSGNEIPGAINLNINVKSDDTDGSETFTVVISYIPVNAVIFYNGDEISHTGTITITGFDNSIPLQIVPAHNSDTDFDLNVKAYTVDTDGTTTVTSEAIVQELTMNVQVRGVADIPVNDTLVKLDASGADATDGIYQAVVSEDMGNTQDGATVNFKAIYTDASLASYDDDTSEVLSIVVTGLAEGFNIEGATFMGGTGEARKWVFDADAVNADEITITTAKNYSGVIDFKVKYVTTEVEGDSKTHDFVPVKILVTPDTEAVMNLKTDVREDVASAVDFSVVSANGDTNEAIHTAWIKKSDVDGKEFDLFVDGIQLNSENASSGSDYYEISTADIGKVTVKYNSDLGSSNDTSFEIKYTTIDSAAGVDDTSDEIFATYNLTLSAVTDGITIEADNITGTNITVDTTTSTEVVTINNTGTFTVEVALNADTTDNSDTDTDGSETVTRLVVEGVPLGISVDGADFTQTADGTNLWFIDVPNGQLDGSFNLTFEVHDELAANVGTEDLVTITAYNQDGTGTAITTATTEMVFVDNITNGSGGITGTVEAVMDFIDYTVVEDTEFTLADIVSITPDATRNDEAYSISFTAMENVEVLDNPSLRTYEENGETVYVLHVGTGDIQTALKSVKFLPELNFNKNNDKGEQVAITAALTAYVPGTRIVDVDTKIFTDTDVTPATDAITATNVVDTILEDAEYNFSITLNTVDDPDYDVIGDITISHSGVDGTLKLSDGTIVIFDSSGNATIPVGQITGLTFTPSEHEAGRAIFEYTATSQEHGASTQEIGGGVITLNIAPDADGLTLDGLAANGTEFTDNTGTKFIKLTTTAGSVGGSTLIDSSETIQTILVDGVPDGFLVYVGDANSQAMAQNAGANINGDNTWNIQVEADGTAPDIWIKAPQDWSGDITGIELTTFVKDGNSIMTASTTFALHVDVVASSITISPTKTFEDAYKWVDINLNANMTDLDDSETMTMTLAAKAGSDALDGTVLFALADGTSLDAAFDNGTWTLAGIDSSEINNIEMLYHDYNGTIDISVVTVDGTNTLFPVATGSFELNLDATTDINLSTETRDLHIVGTSGSDTIIAGEGDDTIVYGSGDIIDGGAGEDTLLLDSNISLDFDSISVDNVEKIELGSGNQTITLDVQDVLDMTDGGNILEVSGDSGDTVTLDDSEGAWAQEATSSKVGFNQYTATDGTDTATLFVEIDVIQS